MPEPVYEELLRLVTPIIAKQDTCMREAISQHERLRVTLRFLITGGTYKDLMHLLSSCYLAPFYVRYDTQPLTN
nr:unnamed protein product [Callosobruchus analis]